MSVIHEFSQQFHLYTCVLRVLIAEILGKHSDDKDEDLKGQISKGVANYVSTIVHISISVICSLLQLFLLCTACLHQYC